MPSVLEQMEAWENLLPSEFSTKQARADAISNGEDFIILTRLGEDGMSFVERLVVTSGESIKFNYFTTIDSIRFVKCEAPKGSIYRFRTSDVLAFSQLEDKGQASIHGNYRYLEIGQNGKTRRSITDKIYGVGPNADFSEFEMKFTSLETRLIRKMLSHCATYEVTEHTLPTSSR